MIEEMVDCFFRRDISTGVYDLVATLARSPLTKTTRTAQYAAVDAKTSLLFAVDNSETERLKVTVQKASKPNRICGFVTRNNISTSFAGPNPFPLTKVKRYNSSNQQDSCHEDTDKANRLGYPPFWTVEHFSVRSTGGSSLFLSNASMSLKFNRSSVSYLE